MYSRDLTKVCCPLRLLSLSSSIERYGLQNTANLIAMKAKMQGYIAFDYTSRYPEGQAYLADLKSKGKMEYEYHLLEAEGGGSGIGKCVEGLDVVFTGKNYGKT